MRVILALLFAALPACGVPDARAAAAHGSPGRQDAAPQAGAVKPEEAEAGRLNLEVVKLFRLGKYGEALPLARRVLELREKALGANHPAVASALYNLGAIHAHKKDYGEAERLYQRAAAVAQQSGAQQAELAADINMQLGVLRFRAGDYEQANNYQRRALSLREQALGASHPKLIPDLLNLIEVHFALRDLGRIDAYLDRVASILRAQPPKKDLAAADRVKNYLCPLLGAKESEAAKKVREVMFMLREPEKAAARDRAAAGDATKVPVSGEVLNGRAVRRVAPDYPPAARAQRVSGAVVVDVTVSEEGKVLEAEAVCGHPLLRGAAVDAARAWRFSPTLLDGKPVKVTGTVTINFVMQ
ncbi:MAG TPA: TonB family protein [Pyrinomonadaceae bacterium]|nr:TonB family protein [Pyrinomonadaceae bacterium]